MNIFAIFIIIIFFLSFDIFSAENTIIELHDISNGSKDQIYKKSEDQTNIVETKIEEINIVEAETEEINIDENTKQENNIDKTSSEEIILVDTLLFDDQSKNIISENENLNEVTVVNEDEVFEQSKEDSSVITIPGYWENSIKDNLDFLFNNLNATSSKVLTSFFVDSLSEYSKSPESYTQHEFDNLRIKILVRMGQKEKALKVLNDITSYNYYKNYYDLLKLNYYLTIYDLSEACEFKESLQESLDDKNNNILKISIFCSFLQNKLEEADLLNSLLLDAQDKDQYFQKIYLNLKNDIIEPIDFTHATFDETSFALYSAMLRIGNLPFTEKFLEFEPANLSLPIILSPSTEISLRLKSAHKAYELGLFNAESLSALYQSVDFSSEELINSMKTLNNYTYKPEMGMALLFQKARIQLLPITKLESLKEFWEYAVNNNLEKLAYDVSRNLINFTEPSSELSEYSILLARAHMFNLNFDQAKKWIAFADNYVEQDDQLQLEKLNNIKFQFDLRKSEDNDSFIYTLENNLISKMAKDEFIDYNETLITVFSTLINQKKIVDKIKVEKKIFDERKMPSRYIINNINNASNSNRIGELILTTIVSLDSKSWNEVHPQHLKLLLESFRNAKLNDLFKDVIIEIFEESKMI